MDTSLSTHPGLKGLRADIPQRAMTPLTVVVGFDVFKHGFTHQGAARKAFAMDTSHFQAVEEALRTGLVVAVSLGAHAASQVMGADQCLVSRRAVLAPAAAMHDYAPGLLALP